MYKKKLYKIMFLILCVCLSITKTYAEECSSTELKELKILANEINFSYEFDEKNKMFIVTAYNYADKTKIIMYGETYKKDGKFNKSYIPGLSYTFIIYGNENTNCNNKVLTKKSISFPNYNNYYGNELCNGIEEFKLCRKWHNTSNITENEFKKEIDKYKNNSPIKENKNWINIVIQIIIEYWYVLLGIIVIILVIMFLKWYKSRNRVKIKI